ncbi:Mag2 protein [Saccharomycopsis crataegensis]|uniref:Mag2 protein n=1 Tax=Saccharomycopsis crataegensis TaxID=43959 RepID=A0AAV5QPJ4_9ASCO|nr:Mag2 protein [Saccharomycopsis crataegensis]
MSDANGPNNTADGSSNIRESENKGKTNGGKASLNNGKRKFKSNRNNGGQNRGRSQSSRSNQDHYNDYEDDLIHNEIIKGGLGWGNGGHRGKGVSINHLLDFSLPERQQQWNGGQRRVPKKKNRFEPVGLHLNPEQFINVNYRFIVDHRGSYESQKLDPNIPIEKHNILRVITRNVNACPICLETEDSVAIRMVSCGHCFCYTCLLTYLDQEDDKKNKKETQNPHSKKMLKSCPLCAVKIEPSETLPVLYDRNSIEIDQFETPKVHEDAILRLMVKPHDSMVALPASINPDFKKVSDIPWCCAKDDQKNLDSNMYPYARIMKGNLDFIINEYQKEIEMITEQFLNDQVMFESNNDKYVKQAIENIQREIKNIKSSFGETEDYVSFSSQNIMDRMNDLSINENKAIKYDIGNAYFYYQTSFNSPTKYLLSTLDVKVLRAVFADYSNFPSTLVLPVENIVHGEILTEHNVGKYKYISHLPFGTELAFLEINWLLGNKDDKSFKLPSNIYSNFKREILNRSRSNKKRSQIEEHNRKVAERNLEIKTREFYERENEAFFHPRGQYELNNYYDSPNSEHRGLENYISTDDFTPLSNGEEHSIDQTKPDENPTEYTTTVWGTKIKKSVAEENDDDEYDETGIRTDDILKKIEEQKANSDKGPGKKKGKKKKLVLLTGSSRGSS